MQMLTTNMSLLTALALAPSLVAQGAQHVVVPAAYGNTDAISFNSLPGASKEVRQQTLIGDAHLTAVVGRAIEAIEFRRTAENEIFAGGTADFTVTLSTSTSPTHEVSSSYANNIGSTQVQVFSGPVSFPTSSAIVGATVNWTANNVVRIQFTTPYLYSGGRLCVDITGTPIAGQQTSWWMADAEFEDIPGTITDLGGGCGSYATSGHVDERTLVVGGYARMSAQGSPYGLAIAAIGQPGGPVPLSVLGFTPPGNCTLMLSSLMILEAMLFIPESNPTVPSNGGRAELELKIPNIAGAQGLTLATQWFDWTQTATTNALEWTIASTSALDMALISGHPLEAKGNVTTQIAHVIRFEYQ